MTRYLPIRKEEFDLRSHIESSGHSVEMCYHIILTEKMCKGYLVKMGGKIKSWKKRWFVFDRLKRTFSYYVGKNRLLLFGVNDGGLPATTVYTCVAQRTDDLLWEQSVCSKYKIPFYPLYTVCGRK